MIINALGITKKHGKGMEPAVNDVSFNVKPDEIISILGPSGCGKTTILRLISGLEFPDKGSIILNGKEVAGPKKWVPPERRGVGMVFQDYALFPHLTVENNIRFGFDGQKSRAEHILEITELTEKASKFPHELSGGQQQRVALARALVRDPVLLLLDEPFSNLDYNMRIKMRQEVTEIIRETGATAIFVTHDQKEALSISDRVIVMNSGKVEQIGTPRQIYETPANEFVACFVGQTNILKGVMAKDNETILTDAGPIPCNHTHNKRPGEHLIVSIRPDSFELDPGGQIKGIILNTSYMGEYIDALVQIFGKKEEHEFIIHLNPTSSIREGERILIKVLPDFTAVIS